MGKLKVGEFHSQIRLGCFVFSKWCSWRKSLETHLENQNATQSLLLTCTALRDAVLAQDNLCKRKFALVIRCYLCHQSLEIVNHLLLHCPLTSEIWNSFLLRSSRKLYTSFIFGRVDKTIKKVWEMIPLVIFWVVLNERNHRCFDGMSIPKQALKAWCVVVLSKLEFSYSC